MPLCTDFSVVNGNRDEGEISMLRCKRWSCEVCNPVNRSKVIALAGKGKATAMLTLTCDHGRYDSPDEAARHMKEALVKFRRIVEGQFGIKKLPFFAVFEKHQSGWPHLHLLIRAKYMHWKVIRGIWKKLTGAYIADIRSLHNSKGAQHYVTKYIGKDLSSFEGCKRWWRSHNFHQEQDDDWQPTIFGSGFVRIGMNFERVQEILEAQKFEWSVSGRYRIRYRAVEDTFRDCFGQVMHWEYAK